MASYQWIEKARELDIMARERASGFNEVLNEFLRDNSKIKDEIPLEKIRPIFRSDFQISEEKLREIDQEVVPLAIVRDLIARYRLVVKRQICPDWPSFVKRYRNAIFA